MPTCHYVLWFFVLFLFYVIFLFLNCGEYQLNLLYTGVSAAEFPQKFNAINITIGLPFIKITPDHGPNFEMIGKNKSDPSSIFYALDFINKIK